MATFTSPVAAQAGRGRSPNHNPHDRMNAIRYGLPTGCQGRVFPTPSLPANRCTVFSVCAAGRRQVKGRTRQIAVEVMRLLLGVLVHPANGADEWAARRLLRRIPVVVRWALFIFDAGYDQAPLLDWGAPLRLAQPLAALADGLPSFAAGERNPD